MIKFNQLYNLLEDTEDDLLSKGFDVYNTFANIFIGRDLVDEECQGRGAFIIDKKTGILNMVGEGNEWEEFENISIQDGQSENRKPVNLNDLLDYIIQEVSQNKVASCKMYSEQHDIWVKYYFGNNAEQMFSVAKKEEKLGIASIINNYFSDRDTTGLEAAILGDGRTEKFSQDELNTRIYIKKLNDSYGFKPIIDDFKDLWLNDYFSIQLPVFLSGLVYVVKNKKAITLKSDFDIILIRPATNNEI